MDLSVKHHRNLSCIDKTPIKNGPGSTVWQRDCFSESPGYQILDLSSKGLSNLAPLVTSIRNKYASDSSKSSQSRSYTTVKDDQTFALRLNTVNKEPTVVPGIRDDKAKESSYKDNFALWLALIVQQSIMHAYQCAHFSTIGQETPSMKQTAVLDIVIETLRRIREEQQQKELSESQHVSHSPNWKSISHKRKPSHQCDYCAKDFRDRCTLLTHMRTHTGEKPYTCETCGDKFRQSGTLTRHTKIHTGDKPYKCECCGKQFCHSSTLIIHKRIHTGENPHQCRICLKRFRQSGHLQKHIMTHEISAVSCQLMARSV